MPMSLRTRSPVASTQRRIASRKAAPISATKPGTPAVPQLLKSLAKAPGHTAFPRPLHRRGYTSAQIVLVRHLQHTHGNRAVQRLIERKMRPHPPAPDQAVEPAAPVLAQPEESVQRFSLSDLNPIEAAKRLAE